MENIETAIGNALAELYGENTEMRITERKPMGESIEYGGETECICGTLRGGREFTAVPNTASHINLEFRITNAERELPEWVEQSIGPNAMLKYPKLEGRVLGYYQALTGERLAHVREMPFNSMEEIAKRRAAWEALFAVCPCHRPSIIREHEAAMPLPNGGAVWVFQPYGE